MSLTSASFPHLAVALDGTGWHPASWREQVARPRDVFTAGYWADLVAEAERGLLDFVTFEDGLGLQSSHYGELDGRTDQVRGRLDAVLVASRIAPLTRHIGLVPTVIATHRSRSTSPRRSPPSTTSAPDGPACACRSHPARTRPTTSAAAPSRR